MWNVNDKGEKEFSGGKMKWKAAASEANSCRLFKCDVEEEIVADDSISCYNCRYRRWTADSFVCVKGFDNKQSERNSDIK